MARPGRPFQGHPRRVRPRFSWPSLRVPYFRLGRAPHKPLDAPDNLLKEAPGQVAFGKLEDVVPGMPDEAPAGLEQPLLQTRQRPTSDGQGQGEPAPEIAEIVGNDP